MPVLTGLGNHESVLHVFNGNVRDLAMDRFPYTTDSGEAVFAQEMVNPSNGPVSEDGTAYDPNPNQIDFPPYQETVFYYTYDNVAMVVLTADYWYAPNWEDPENVNFSGGLHGYLMDNQLDWLEKLLVKLDADSQLDHVVITVHAPIFPNGGHLTDAMWYHGDNKHRATVLNAEGKNLVSRGMIEQRDKLLEILMKSPKVKFICTGDEHNFHITHLTQETNIYPTGWDKTDIRKRAWFRELWQINNGAAGAPYYGQETAPWTPSVKLFSTQNALAFFHVSGKAIRLEVINPDTLAEIMQMEF
jgi:3',5'-cyclic AMP phosphodiesterase CpdA